MLEVREAIQKTYRLETRQADDLERLAKQIGRTQNDLVVIAIGHLLNENRAYFIGEMIKERCTDILEEKVLKMKEPVEMVRGGMTLKMDITDTKDLFEYSYIFKNSIDDILINESGKICVTDKEQWDAFIDNFVEKVKHYINPNEPGLVKYFEKRFIYK